jgi:hypothetical protein
VEVAQGAWWSAAHCHIHGLRARSRPSTIYRLGASFMLGTTGNVGNGSLVRIAAAGARVMGVWLEKSQKAHRAVAMTVDSAGIVGPDSSRQLG